MASVFDTGGWTPEVSCSCESFESDGIIGILTVGWLHQSDSLYPPLHQLLSAEELNQAEKYSWVVGAAQPPSMFFCSQ